MNNGLEDIQMGLYRSREKGGSPLPVSAEEWEERARNTLGSGPFDYVYGAAGAGDTLRANLEAFQRYRIRPRMCSDISNRDMTVTLFGATMPYPFMLAPIGVNTILHPEGERGPAKAAAKLGIPYVLSNVSTVPMEEIAKTMGDATRWFQLYPPKSKELTKSFLNRAKKAGFTAIVVTVDSTLLGWRERDLSNAYLPFLSGEGLGNYFTDPVFRSMLEEPPEQNKAKAVTTALEEGNNTCFTWADLSFIRESTDLTLLIKGLTHPADAILARENGVDGIIVSNHGGRQLDGAVASLDSLPGVVEAVKGEIPVLMDSGIRRGADVIKALALGAKAVLLGRPYAYALAVAGELGVEQVLKNLAAETELQLAISGSSSISQIHPSLLSEVYPFRQGKDQH